MREDRRFTAVSLPGLEADDAVAHGEDDIGQLVNWPALATAGQFDAYAEPATIGLPPPMMSRSPTPCAASCGRSCSPSVGGWLLTDTYLKVPLRSSESDQVDWFIDRDRKYRKREPAGKDGKEFTVCIRSPGTVVLRHRND